MKKFLFILIAVSSMTACQNDDDDRYTTDPVEPYVISFESLKDFNGNEPVFTEDGIIWGKSYAEEALYDWGEDWDDDERYSPYKMYHGLLFSDDAGCAKFGSYYDNGEQWGYGIEFDVWNGFAVSRNYNKTADRSDLSNQFSVWATGGANGTDTFAVVYSPDLNWFDPVGAGTPYQIPTIEFQKECEVQSFWVANSTYTYPYKSYASESPVLTLTVTAYLAGKEVGSQNVELIGATEKISDWTKIECSFGSKVDKLVFIVNCEDDDLFPKYFCLDEITVVY